MRNPPDRPAAVVGVSVGFCSPFATGPAVMVLSLL